MSGSRSFRLILGIAAWLACSGAPAGNALDIAACPPARPPDRGVSEAAALEKQVDAIDVSNARSAPLVALLDKLAVAFERMDRFDRAEEVLSRALTLRESARAKPVEVAHNLARIGLMQRAQGRLDEAEVILKRCVAVADAELGVRSEGAARCRNMLGLVYMDRGRYSEARDMLMNALAVREKVLPADHPDLELTLNLVGTLYLLLGDARRAENYYLRSVAIAEKTYGMCHPVYASTLHFLANAYDALDRPHDALPVRERSLALREQVLPAEDHSVAHGVMGLSETLLALRDFQRAEPLARRAVALHEKINGSHHSRTLRSMWALTRILEKNGRADEGISLIIRGMQDATAEHTPEFLWRFLSAYSTRMREAGNASAAIYFGKQAVDTIQGMRRDLTVFTRGIQQSFLLGKSDVYRQLADVLIERGRLPEAQQVLAMLKEEEFFDYILRDAKGDTTTTPPRFTAAEEPWARRYAEIRSTLGNLGARRNELAGRASGVGDAGLEQFAEDLKVARQAMVAFLDELNREMAALDKRGRPARDLEGLENYQDDLKALGHGAVMLHYVVLPDKVRIILTTPDDQVGEIGEMGEAELNAKILQFRTVLQNPMLDPRKLGQELYRALIGPVAEHLRLARAQTLMIALDGTLRYLPFAALHDGQRYLVEAFRVSVLTEAARTKLTDKPLPMGRFAGLGLTRAITTQPDGQEYTALPAVKQELEGILASGALKGEIYLDDDFTAQRLRQALAQKVTVLHVASHFVFNPGTETQSFLVLGTGETLTLRALREADYNFRGVDLLTLSACDTAVGGGADANGREVEGLGTLAQQRGARAVMATLWPVVDESTGLLMEAFYRLRGGKSGMTKAEALRQAQRALLEGAHAAPAAANAQISGGLVRPSANTPPFESDPKAPFAHPYFWAPFILMGNWL